MRSSQNLRNWLKVVANLMKRFYFEDPLDSFNPEKPFTPDLIKLFVNRESEIKFISGYVIYGYIIPHKLKIHK